jgi:hypothetical protein
MPEQISMLPRPVSLALVPTELLVSDPVRRLWRLTVNGNSLMEGWFGVEVAEKDICTTLTKRLVHRA